MGYKEVVLSQDGGVAILKLNRPSRLNALSAGLLDEIGDAIDVVLKDEAVHCVVITGEGRGFCAGADLAGGGPAGTAPVPELPRSTRLEPFARFGRMVMQLRNTTKPTIAAVNGLAVGAGLSLSLLCDIRIAAADARFSAIFVKRGLVADTGCTYLLPRTVGVAKALEMMYTGDMVGAEEALRVGLVSQVVPPDKLLPTALELARRIASGPSVSIELMKRMVYQGLEADNFVASFAFEGFAQNVAHTTEDAKEGVKSFLEKREANFKGK